MKGLGWRIVLIVFAALMSIFMVVFCEGFNETVETTSTKTPTKKKSSEVAIKKIVPVLEEERSDEEYIAYLRDNEKMILDKIKEKKDDVEMKSWYYGKTTPIGERKSNVYLYFGYMDDEYKGLYVKFRLDTKEIVLFDRIVVNTDGDVQEIELSTTEILDKHTDVYLGGTTESHYERVSGDTLDIVLDIIHSEKTMIRYKSDTLNEYADYEVTAEEKEAMKDTMMAHQMLTGDFKYDFGDLPVKIDEDELKAREAYLQALKEDEEAVMAKIRTDENVTKGITWYYDKTSPQYPDNNAVFLYFGQKKDMVYTPRMKLLYTGEDWVHFKKVVFHIDGEEYAVDVDKEDKRSKSFSDGFYETYDHKIYGTLEEVVCLIPFATEVTVSIEGTDGQFEYSLDDKQKQAMRNVLEAYQVVSGKFVYDFKAAEPKSEEDSE